MVINAENQGDWQELDPRSADAVREVEEGILRSVGFTRSNIAELFSSNKKSRLTTGKAAEKVVTSLSKRVKRLPSEVSTEVRKNLEGEFADVVRQERLTPHGNAVERIERQTKNVAAAVRRAVPADLFERAVDDTDFPTDWEVKSGTLDIKIDLTHDFWQNRIQNRDELVSALTGLKPEDIGITGSGFSHPGPPVIIDKSDAEKIADSTFSGSTAAFHKRLLENRARTLFSDEQVSSLNVETAVQILQNDNVRRAISPPSADLAQTELNNLVQEKSIVEKFSQLQAVEMPTFPARTASWQDIINEFGKMSVDEAALTSAAAGTPQRFDSLDTTVNFDSNTAIFRDQRNTVLRQLGERKRELQEAQSKFQRYFSLLAGISKAADAVRNRKNPGASLLIEAMVDVSTGTPIESGFTASNNPQVVVSDLESTLSLRSSASEYDADIATQKEAVADAKAGKNTLTGRDAVLAVYDNYYRRVKRLDPRRAEEARQTLYARNEQGREEHQARKEAVDDLIGKNDQWSAIHSLRYGRPKTIVKKLARTDAIGASVSSGEVKWSELSYPRLMTAFAALRKLNEDGAETMKLQTTSYFRKQLETVTSLLADKFTEQVERDYAREPETPEQKKERQAQGERNRKQRLLRLLIHNPVPGTYTQRAGVAIADAYKKMHRVRKATSAAAKWSWKNLVVDRAKNVFKGEGHVANPLTYPARGTKGVAKGIWKLLNLEV